MSFDPYIHFQGNCRAAMEAYRQVFGGTLSIMGYDQMPDAPPETRLDQPLRYREMPFIGNDPPDIASFLAHYPEGIIALSPDLPTRTAWLGLEVADGHTYLRRLGLELTELHRVNVPMPDEMRPGGTKSTDRMDIVAYRYRPATLPPPG